MRDGWRRVALGEVARLDIEKVPVVAGQTYNIAGVLNAGQGMLSRDPIDGSETNYPALHRLRTDQLVMRKLTAWEGPITIVPEEYDGYVVSTEFPTFTLDQSQLLPGFMRLVCQQPEFWERMRDSSTGSVQRRKRTNPSQLMAIDIHLPPVAEQRRIVDVAIATEMAAERAVHLGRCGSEVYFALLRTAFDQHLTLTDSIRSLGEVSVSRLGKMLSAQAQTGLTRGLPYVRNADVQWDEIRLSDLNLMEFSAKEQEEFALRSGDVLVCEGGEVGRAAVVAADLEGIYFQKAIHRVRCGDQLLPRYLMHYLRHCSSSGGFADLATTMTIQHLTGEKLRRLQLPVPMLQDQQKVIEELDAANRLNSTASWTTVTTARLKSALLADLLSGAHEIPASYDARLERAS